MTNAEYYGTKNKAIEAYEKYLKKKFGAREDEAVLIDYTLEDFTDWIFEEHDKKDNVL